MTHPTLRGWLLVMLLPFMLLAGCGGGNSAPTATQITSQPASVAAATGSDAVFTVAASGETLAYQWQRSDDGGSTWMPIAGATADRYTLAAAPASASGAQFRVAVSGAAGSVTSDAATLTVADPPAIVQQPADAATRVGVAVQFSVQASGGEPLAYQWQSSSDGGTSFVDLAGASGATLSLPAPTAADNGLQLRVQVSNAVGTQTSRVAVLSVSGPPVIGTQPQPATVLQGQPASFSVVAAAQPAPTYQWQRSADGVTWTDIAGAVAASYQTAATTPADDGARFRVVVGNAEGSVTSAAVTLTVTAEAAPQFTRQPDDATVTAGATATFTAAASGVPAPSYQWQSSSDGGTTWTDITGATQASFTTPVLQTADNGRRLRVIARNSAGSATSRVALLGVGAAGGGGGVVAAAVACNPWTLPDGTVVEVAMPGTGGVTAVSSQTVRQGVGFQGRTTTDVLLNLPLTPTVSVLTHNYASADAAGVLTVYGSDTTSTGSAGGSTITQQTTLVYTPPVQRLQFSLAPGGSEGLLTAAATATVVDTVDGVVGAPQTSSAPQDFDAVQFVGYETLTLGAGSFSTCKFVYTSHTGSTRTEWVSRRYAAILKNSSGGVASRLTVNGTVVTGD